MALQLRAETGSDEVVKPTFDQSISGQPHQPIEAETGVQAPAVVVGEGDGLRAALVNSSEQQPQLSEAALQQPI